ncbi:pyridoxal phosphate-dependent transferase, partial [Immersiella caudata]
MDSKGFREAAVSSIDEIISYYDNISERPVKSTVEPGYLRKLLPSEAPEDGEEWSDIQQDIEAKIMPGITHWQHPSFHAFFPCASSYPSILGELYSAALSAAAFNWICSPAVTELETIVLDWLAKLLGLPECFLSTGSTNGGGVIQGSASEAVLTAMVAAREKYLAETIPSSLEGEAREDAIAVKRSRMVALATSATHSSTKKAALILGVRFITIPVTSETNYALTGPILAAAIESCRARNLEPFFLTATLGTTDTCAVDDFPSISSTLSTHASSPGEIWVHIDAAYAGAALVCPEHQTATSLPTTSTFHSFNMNMHKWLLTNFDASCLYVRNRAWFIRALTINQAVYNNSHSQGGLVTDYREWQIPLGRRFRALKIWFVLRSYGASGLRAYIRKTTSLGESFASWVRERDDLFEILTPPAFALAVFRMKGRDEEEANRRTKELERRVDGCGKMWVTSTVLEGRFAIRMVTSVRSTERADVERAFGMFVEFSEGVLK